jgi:hypothetical protein
MTCVDKIKNGDAMAAVIKTLKSMGYKTTKPRHKNSNGVDLFAIKQDNVLSVEVKRAIYPKKDRNVLRVRGVEKNRKNDDLIAIVLPCGYVLIEPMKHHLLSCNHQGDRFLNY